MSHTHRRDSLSDFSIDRILSKETVPTDKLPSTAFVANHKVDWLRNACKLPTTDSDSDPATTEQTDTRGVQSVERSVHSDPTQISEELSWLRCTRYHPPKLPRKSCSSKNAKRKPGTHPRIPFTKYQLDILEEKYKSSAYLSRKDVVCLSEVLQLPQSRIKIWFQNRRARERRESQTFTQTQTSGS